MGFPKQYFKQAADAPAPLCSETDRRVRFEEVDSIRMVWHGRYPSYFEDGRISFGDAYGLNYQSFMKNRVMAPIVQMHFDFKFPLRFDETMRIRTCLHWNQAMRLDFSYRIVNGEDRLCAQGYTVQVLTDPDGTVLFVPPEWMLDFRQKWQAGHWSRP